jgi:hypothetical protein
MRFKGLFFTLLALCGLAFSSLAQILEPVKWSFSLGPIENNEADVIAKATIDKKWHVYALSVSSDPNAIGPIPTSLTLKSSASFSLAGKVSEGKFITHFDPNFDMDLNYFENSATFRQRIKIIDTQAFKLKGTLEYMACDDARCIFPDPVNFTINVTPPAATAADGAAASEPTGILQPVKWLARLEKISDTEFDVVYTAAMEKGWHVYSQLQTNAEGPVATSFQFGPNEAVTPQGSTSEGKPTKVYDNNFMMDVSYFSQSADFRQRLKLSGPAPSFYPTSLEFMCCNDETCLPPTTIHFKLDFAALTAVEYTPESDLKPVSSGNQDPF